MNETSLGIDLITPLFCAAVKKTLEKSTGKVVSYSKTTQEIPQVCLKPDLGCFVQYDGDYNGLVVMNFSEESALVLYRSYMMTMGLPEDGLALEVTSSEVVDTIGEMTNQIMGRAVRMVENKYDLSAKFGQPKSLALNSAIILTPEFNSINTAFSSDIPLVNNRRIVFKIGTARFHMEIAMEKTDFVTIS